MPITIPDKNSIKFSELVGILLGDGHISNQGIEISLEYPAEEDYYQYVKGLLSVLFGRIPITKFKKSSKSVVYLVINSKKLVKFLNHIGLPTGNKVSNGVQIPKFIFKKKSLLKWCIRGLVDTDGGIFNKQSGYSRCLIEFSNHSGPLIATFDKGLKFLGFTPSKGGNNSTRIQKQNEIDKYAIEIGFSNKKNLVKYRYIKKFGYIPKQVELREILAMRV